MGGYGASYHGGKHLRDLNSSFQTQDKLDRLSNVPQDNKTP